MFTNRIEIQKWNLNALSSPGYRLLTTVSTLKLPPLTKCDGSWIWNKIRIIITIHLDQYSRESNQSKTKKILAKHGKKLTKKTQYHQGSWRMRSVPAGRRVVLYTTRRGGTEPSLFWWAWRDLYALHRRTRWLVQLRAWRRLVQLVLGGGSSSSVLAVGNIGERDRKGFCARIWKESRASLQMCHGGSDSSVVYDPVR